MKMFPTQHGQMKWGDQIPTKYNKGRNHVECLSFGLLWEYVQEDAANQTFVCLFCFFRLKKCKWATLQTVWFLDFGCDWFFARTAASNCLSSERSYRLHCCNLTGPPWQTQRKNFLLKVLAKECRKKGSSEFGKCHHFQWEKRKRRKEVLIWLSGKRGKRGWGTGEVEWVEFLSECMYQFEAKKKKGLTSSFINLPGPEQLSG